MVSAKTNVILDAHKFLLNDKKIKQLKNDIPNKVSTFINQHIDSFIQLDKISDNQFFDKNILPTINTHIDVFINEKLAKEIPMLSMFIGTKTTDKVKEVFVDNVRDLFPAVIKNYAENLIDKEKINNIIEQKVQPIIQSQLENNQTKIFKSFILLGIVVGIIISFIQLIILSIVG